MSMETTETVPKTETDGDKPEIDWKARSREWEKRAKANSDAAERLATLEAAQQSDAERLASARAAAERERDDAKAESLRLRIALRYKISDEDADLFLTGADEETMTRQAERLAGKVAEDPKVPGNVVPKEGKTTPPPKGDPVAEFTRNLFSPEA